ncbi:MAG: helix-turn-helix domain-containing protein [Archangiaceae bacterium]|nr:helix-turn-helix domain-containing protein [Archangiaceae bacterium]
MASFVEVSGAHAFVGEGRRFYAGRCFLYWQDGTRALGTVMWGRPLEADVQAMVPFFEVGVARCFAGHASFVDGRGLEAVDVLAFGKLLAYLTARRSAWGPNIGRQAVLHPGGFVGVVVSGALHVARPPYPFESFSDERAREAFAYGEVEDLFEPVERLRLSVSSPPEVVRALRAVLTERGHASSGQLARAMGLSTRTLQRRLEEAGSSLRDERRRHLSLQVEQLLSGTALDLEAIAARVGLHSASHLVRHFRATHDGETPGAWREKRRPAHRG